MDSLGVGWRNTHYLTLSVKLKCVWSKIPWRIDDPNCCGYSYFQNGVRISQYLSVLIVKWITLL